MNDVQRLLLKLRQKQIIPACSGLKDINRREDPPLLKLTVQHKLHVAGTLKLLINYIIHTRAGIHQRGCKDGKRATLPHISSCTKETLRHMQCRRIQTSGQGSTGCRNHKVISSRKSCNGIQKDGNILSLLHQPLGSLDRHLRNSLVMLRKLIKGGVNDLHHTAFNLLLHVRNFLRTLINEENEQMHLGLIPYNCLGNLL